MGILLFTLDIIWIDKRISVAVLGRKLWTQPPCDSAHLSGAQIALIAVCCAGLHEGQTEKGRVLLMYIRGALMNV